MLNTQLQSSHLEELVSLSSVVLNLFLAKSLGIVHLLARLGLFLIVLVHSHISLRSLSIIDGKLWNDQRLRVLVEHLEAVLVIGHALVIVDHVLCTDCLIVGTHLEYLASLLFLFGRFPELVSTLLYEVEQLSVCHFTGLKYLVFAS